MNEGLQFYRCVLCNRVVSPWDIQEHHGCAHCGNNKIKPSDLTLWEKIIQILKHPAIWRWTDASV